MAVTVEVDMKGELAKSYGEQSCSWKGTAEIGGQSVELRVGVGYLKRENVTFSRKEIKDINAKNYKPKETLSLKTGYFNGSFPLLFSNNHVMLFLDRLTSLAEDDRFKNVDEIKCTFKDSDNTLGWIIFNNKGERVEGHLDGKYAERGAYEVKAFDNLLKIYPLLTGKKPREGSYEELGVNKLARTLQASIELENSVYNEKLKKGIFKIPWLEGYNVGNIEKADYKKLAKSSEETLKFLQSKTYKNITEGKKKDGIFKSLKKGTNRIINKITGAESKNVQKLYDHVANSLNHLELKNIIPPLSSEESEKYGEFIGGELENLTSDEIKRFEARRDMIEKIEKTIKNLKDVEPNNGYLLAYTLYELLKNIEELSKEEDFHLTWKRNIWMDSVHHLAMAGDDKIDQILKQYNILDADDKIRRVAAAGYILQMLNLENISKGIPKAKYSESKQRDDKKIRDKENSYLMGSIMKKYNAVCKKFRNEKKIVTSDDDLTNDKEIVSMLGIVGASFENDLEPLCKNCIKLAEKFLPDNDDDKRKLQEFSGNNSNLNSLLLQFKSHEFYDQFNPDLEKLKLCELLLDKLLATDALKEVNKTLAKEEGQDAEDLETKVDDKFYNEFYKYYSRLKNSSDLGTYLDETVKKFDALKSDKEWKKWYSYVKDKTLDLKNVINEFVKKHPDYLKGNDINEVKFISILYILSRSSERVKSDTTRDQFIACIRVYGMDLYNGKTVPGLFKDSLPLKEAAYKLFKVCHDSADPKGLSKKQCIKILECISKDRSNEDSEKFLKLENKIKLKLKAY